MAASDLSSFKGQVVTQDDPGYANSIERWATNSQRDAKYVLFPQDTSDISRALSFARENNLKLTVAGGRHAPDGSASIEGGVVVDLSKGFNYVRIDAEKKIAYVGGGAQWELVDSEAAKYGLATVGGTVNDTGVGGLTLGGGLGWLTGRYGAVCDNLIEATVILADGSTVTTSETSNPDLFWALRGAGANFGVTTEFVFRLHDQANDVFVCLIMFPPTQVEKVTAAAMEIYKRQNPDSGAFVFMARGPDGQPTMMYDAYFNGSEGEGREFFKPIFDIVESKDSGAFVAQAGQMPYQKLNAIMNEKAVPRRSRIIKGVGFNDLSPDLIRPLFDRFSEICDGVFSESAVVFELYSHDVLNKTPVDAMAFPTRGSHGNAILECSWKTGGREHEPRAFSIVRELAGIIEAKEGATVPVYANYNGEWNDAKRLFGEQKYGKLQELKKKFDPERVFDSWYPIEPAA